MKKYFYEIRFSRLALIIFVAVIFIATGFAKQPPLDLLERPLKARLRFCSLTVSWLWPR
jgi:hypothetical protein